MSCESLKNEQNPDILEEKARLIYEDYISILSPKEVRRRKKVISFLSFLLNLLFFSFR
jgi:regulator of G-protein signaling